MSQSARNMKVVPVSIKSTLINKVAMDDDYHWETSDHWIPGLTNYLTFLCKELCACSDNPSVSTGGMSFHKSVDIMKFRFICLNNIVASFHSGLIKKKPIAMFYLKILTFFLTIRMYIS